MFKIGIKSDIETLNSHIKKWFQHACYDIRIFHALLLISYVTLSDNNNFANRNNRLCVGPAQSVTISQLSPQFRGHTPQIVDRLLLLRG